MEQLVKTTDGSVALQAQQVQATGCAWDVLNKLRAYLFSLSYVSCATPDWCKFSQTRATVEEISVKIQEAERHCAAVSFYNDAYLASAQMWQNKIVMENETLTVALACTGSWLQFWNYQCPGCVTCNPKGKGKGKSQAAARSVDETSRQRRRNTQNQVWHALSRYGGKGDGGYGKSGGGKGQMPWKVQKKQWDKPNGKDGGKGGKNGGKNGGKKGGKNKTKQWW